MRALRLSCIAFLLPCCPSIIHHFFRFLFPSLSFLFFVFRHFTLYLCSFFFSFIFFRVWVASLNHKKAAFRLLADN